MRYCPHCRRINPGRPQICHFCGRTWSVRLCPRGHENPYNAQYCGNCGSADLSETAGQRSWLIIMLKMSLWLFMGLCFYVLISAIVNFFRPPLVYRLLYFLIIISLLLIGTSFAFSLLPIFIKKQLGQIAKLCRKLFLLALRSTLKRIWDVMK